MVELSERWLASVAGWPVVHEARKLREGGRVLRATYEAGVLKGVVKEGAKTYAAGLRITSASEVENLCPCKPSRAQGKVCAHSVAAALFLALGEARGGALAAPEAAAPADGGVRIVLEGSLQGVEAEVEAADLTTRAAVAAQLGREGFVARAGRLTLNGRDAVLRFLAEGAARLPSTWQIESGPRFRTFRAALVPVGLRGSLEADTEAGWLRLHCELAAGDVALPWEDVRRAAATGRPTLDLPDGRMALVNRDQLSDLEATLAEADVRHLSAQKWQVPAAQADFVRLSLAEWQGEGTNVRSSAEIALGALAETLRPYQKAGVFWLADRARTAGGAILADDMGLGKTLQALALMSHLGGPCLVVCPASLVFNWAAEAARFWPEARVVRWAGPKRREQISRLPEADLVITNYALLRTDAADLSAIGWQAVVLDEAQHIKNPDSQNAAAAGALRGGFRLALTGTPLENSLRDLWSLANFAVPGYLGAETDFRDRYIKPLESSGDADVRQRLRRRLGPLVLRRTKAEVLPELPPKLAISAYCDMAEDQRQIYSRLQRDGWQEVESLDARTQGAARKMAMLTLLLRLRQACCDPGLLPGMENAGISSAKTELLRELLAEAADAGSRTLVFSQFTSMLRRLRSLSESWGIASCYLDGKTADRELEVRRFRENPEFAVFFISLKAGGTGLNLTEADHVVHFDPWWNPATEDQATDRVHRIGQTKSVLIRRLIVAGSVEENVVRLQGKKRMWSAEFLENDAAVVAPPEAGALTDEELVTLVKPANE